MDLVDQSLVFAILLSIGIVVGAVPSPLWVRAIVFFSNTISPAWFAWATGLWPFYIISAVMLTAFVLVVTYTTGKAMADAQDRP